MPSKTAPSPTRAAMQRITEILARGAGPDRMGRVVDDIVARLHDEGDPEEVQAWLEELRDGFADSAEAAIEAVDEIDAGQKAERRHAENAARAMEACRDAFGRHAVGTPQP